MKSFTDDGQNFHNILVNLCQSLEVSRTAFFSDQLLLTVSKVLEYVSSYPADIYLFKVNIANTKLMY